MQSSHGSSTKTNRLSRIKSFTAWGATIVLSSLLILSAPHSAQASGSIQAGTTATVPADKVATGYTGDPRGYWLIDTSSAFLTDSTAPNGWRVGYGGTTIRTMTIQVPAGTPAGTYTAFYQVNASLNNPEGDYYGTYYQTSFTVTP